MIVEGDKVYAMEACFCKHETGYRVESLHTDPECAEAARQAVAKVPATSETKITLLKEGA
jgi:hypothetical protein